MIVVAIIGILASVAIRSMRDYSRRATLSEVVLASGGCKTLISENYNLLSDPPDAGSWGCESTNARGKHTGTIQTSSNGVIRIAIINMDSLVNNQYIHLVPANSMGSPMVSPDNLGQSVKQWLCGSDWQPVRNSLPANCRIDTTTFASQDFLP
ncbi:pilin [Ramlibacter sp. PS4R-6]|uniref:pilin n=1 Tax=Ramlibacter sp. PS4R-6 TaxID=3133438 RepID=UPI0030B4BCF4